MANTNECSHVIEGNGKYLFSLVTKPERQRQQRAASPSQAPASTVILADFIYHYDHLVYQFSCILTPILSF
jgi:hypothetical protein